MLFSAALRDCAEKLLTQCGRLFEHARALDRGGGRHLLFDATHLHAQVLGGAGDNHALGSEFLHDYAAYLGGHALLHLQAARVEIHETGQFAQPDGASVRNVADV